jgi:hypothetical protein
MRGLAQVVQDCGYPDFVCLQVEAARLRLPPRPAPCACPAPGASRATPLRLARTAAALLPTPPSPAHLGPPPLLLLLLLLLQEATPNIVRIWRASAWYERYRPSPVPADRPYFTHLLVKRAAAAPADCHFSEHRFPNSIMGEPPGRRGSRPSAPLSPAP